VCCDVLLCVKEGGCLGISLSSGLSQEYDKLDEEYDILTAADKDQEYDWLGTVWGFCPRGGC
jgi:hypothetical protein